MKKIKTVKGKIATGVIAASIIGTSTFAFANTNAGTQFGAWGQAQIDAAKAAIVAAIGDDRTNALSNAEDKANTDRDAAEGRVNQAGTDEKADTKTKIETRLGEHMASLQAALATFMANIGGDFDTLVAAENGKTTSDLNNKYNTLSANITDVLTAANARNVEDVTEQSLLVKGQATSDLIKEINRVKSALQTEIDNQKATAEGEVDAHLTSEVNRINGQLDSLISGLETAAKADIAAAGLAVEQSADANFDKVIGLLQTNTPIVVDGQKLSWKLNGISNGVAKFEVVNRNEFDVVFKYGFHNDIDGNLDDSGVSETLSANVRPGKTELVFDVHQLLTFFGPLDLPGLAYVQWLDENGQWQDDFAAGN